MFFSVDLIHPKLASDLETQTFSKASLQTMKTQKSRMENYDLMFQHFHFKLIQSTFLLKYVNNLN